MRVEVEPGGGGKIKPISKPSCFTAQNCNFFKSRTSLILLSMLQRVFKSYINRLAFNWTCFTKLRDEKVILVKMQCKIFWRLVRSRVVKREQSIVQVQSEKTLLTVSYSCLLRTRLLPCLGSSDWMFNAKCCVATPTSDHVPWLPKRGRNIHKIWMPVWDKDHQNTL